MLNERARDWAEVPAVEAPAVEVRENPDVSGRDDVLAVRPGIERSSVVIFEVRCAIWDELPIDSNAIRCNLHAVAANGRNRLQ